MPGVHGNRAHHLGKAEAANYYVSRARYSPLSGGGRNRSGDNRVGFGSGVPRWPQQQSRGAYNMYCLVCI